MSEQSQESKRYGCFEFREETELVVTGRANESSLARYHRHRASCPDCNRHHQIVAAIYEGPRLQRGPDPLDQADEFGAILERAAEERRSERTRYVAARVGLAAGIAAIVGGAFFFGSTDRRNQRHVQPIVATDVAEPGALDHHAQAFGRVIAGEGTIIGADDRVLTEGSFSVDTSIEVPGPDDLQVVFAGTILTNFEPNSRARWTHASPELVELDLQQGMVAVRYDRADEDPILQITTPTATVRVVGTVFTVAVAADGATVVSVLRGQVEVLAAKSSKVLATLDAGYRFDVRDSTFADVTRLEVAAAMPLSDHRAGDKPHEVPRSWFVPSLDAGDRSLERVPLHPQEDELILEDPPDRESTRSPRRTRKPRHNEGGDVLDELLAVADEEPVERSPMKQALHRCQDLYDDPDTRYRASACLTHFFREHRGEPGAYEALLLIGILRMDYAHDYTAATHDLEAFLAKAPANHAKAELAYFRLWLAATEDGDIPDAMSRGREYLERYPQGKFVGRLLRRMPELKSSI